MEKNQTIFCLSLNSSLSPAPQSLYAENHRSQGVHAMIKRSFREPELQHSPQWPFIPCRNTQPDLPLTGNKLMKNKILLTFMCFFRTCFREHVLQIKSLIKKLTTRWQQRYAAVELNRHRWGAPMCSAALSRRQPIVLGKGAQPGDLHLLKHREGVGCKCH